MRVSIAVLLTLGLTACASAPHYRPVSDVPVRIGKPYTVRGITYRPAADPAYDRLGYASWYGPESGMQTANGERFRPDGISGAHTTLPLPSYVEVTSLETGRVILLRINDRGPFSGRGRIIDLSRGAGRLLGIAARGSAPVRVRLVDPPEADRRRLRDGHAALGRPSVPQAELVPLRAQLAGVAP
jgi:rare lipoprotein A